MTSQAALGMVTPSGDAYPTRVSPLRPALGQWRDAGLRGYGFDGLRRAGWCGHSEDHDFAFVEGLYGTGLRLREGASILDVELPVATGRMTRAWLAAACIKVPGQLSLPAQPASGLPPPVIPPARGVPGNNYRNLIEDARSTLTWFA